MKTESVKVKMRSNSLDWTALHDYVAKGCRDASALLYVKVQGDAFGNKIHPGDVVVIDTERKPVSGDTVLLFDGEFSSFNNFANIKHRIRKLKLAVRNGAVLNFDDCEIEVIGVVTHCLKSFGKT